MEGNLCAMRDILLEGLSSCNFDMNFQQVRRTLKSSGDTIPQCWIGVRVVSLLFLLFDRTGNRF